MSDLDDLVLGCLPEDDEHPRHRGLRTYRRWAAYEATAVGIAFGAWVLGDVVWRRISSRS